MFILNAIVKNYHSFCRYSNNPQINVWLLVYRTFMSSFSELTAEIRAWFKKRTSICNILRTDCTDLVSLRNQSELLQCMYEETIYCVTTKSALSGLVYYLTAAFTMSECIALTPRVVQFYLFIYLKKKQTSHPPNPPAFLKFRFGSLQ